MTEHTVPATDEDARGAPEGPSGGRSELDLVASKSPPAGTVTCSLTLAKVATEQATLRPVAVERIELTRASD